MDIRSSELDGHFLLRNGFSCDGPILARDMTVNGSVDLKGAAFNYNGVDDIDVEGARTTADGECFSFSRSIAKSFNWRFMNNKPAAKVSLRDAKVGAFNHSIGQENWESHWPVKGNLVLEGFKYDRFGKSNVASALAWIDLQNDDDLYAYAALADAYKKQHSYDEMEEVLITTKKKQLNSIKNSFRRIFLKIVYFSIGYGKSPSTALIIFLFFFLVQFVLLLLSSCNGYIGPSTNPFLMEPCFLGEGTACSKDISSWSKVIINPSADVRYIPATYPKFHLFEYTLETMLPFLDFKQREYWGPSTSLLKVVLSSIPVIGIFFGGIFVGGVSGLISPKNKIPSI